MIEDNGVIQVDIPTAHKYANLITAKGHTFGTHYFANMNHYQIGALLNVCEITVEFYKAVAERSMDSKRKFDLAANSYLNGNYKQSALAYLELAEEGHLFSEINAGVLFKNHKIFSNSTFNEYLSKRYFKRSAEGKSAVSYLYLADNYYVG